ncbi:MAG: prepilin-type N-terminal cleavage/methylation domain-containing protein [Candidatus Spechtbacterales bacterium]
MRGFTLIEILVAATIFAVAVGAISSLFVMSLRGQRNILAQQNLLDNTRFASEQMSRQIRMAQRDEVGSCTGDVGSTYGIGGTRLAFIDYRGNCLTYELSGSKLRTRPNTEQAFVDLTSDDIRIQRLDFGVRGRLSSDGEQPRVTISIEAEAAGQSRESSPAVILQTTVSARNIDVP